MHRLHPELIGECTGYIQNSSAGTIVTLTTNIDNHDGDCIDFGGNDNIIFDCDGFVIDGDDDANGDAFEIMDANHSEIRGCTLQEFDRGLRTIVTNTTGNFTITTFQNLVAGSGIVWAAENGNLTEVTCYDCSGTASFYLAGDSNTMTNCNASYSNDGWGLYINTGNYNVIENMTLIENTINGSTIKDTKATFYGIEDIVGGNAITNNTIDGGAGGIWLRADNDTIFGNQIVNITNLGETATCLKLDDINDTVFYNNEVRNCSVETSLAGTKANSWNTTESTNTNIIGNAGYAGNFWDSYTGVDRDGDNIGDTSHTLAASNIDYLPLVEPDFSTVAAETDDLDQDWNFSATPDDNELMNIHFNSTGNVNNTIYFTLTDDLANTTLVTANSTINLTLDDDEYITLNMTIGSSAPSGSYEGNMT
jgi:hypothetical protein